MQVWHSASQQMLVHNFTFKFIQFLYSAFIIIYGSILTVSAFALVGWTSKWKTLKRHPPSSFAWSFKFRVFFLRLLMQEFYGEYVLMVVDPANTQDVVRQASIKFKKSKKQTRWMLTIPLPRHWLDSSIENNTKSVNVSSKCKLHNVSTLKGRKKSVISLAERKRVLNRKQASKYYCSLSTDSINSHLYFIRPPFATYLLYF